MIQISLTLIDLYIGLSTHYKNKLFQKLFGVELIDLYIGLSTTRFSISFSLIYHIMTYFYLLFNIFPQNHQKSPSTSKSPYPIFLDFKLFFQSSIFLQRSTDFFTVMPRQFFLLHHQNTLLLLPSLYIPLSF